MDSSMIFITSTYERMMLEAIQASARARMCQAVNPWVESEALIVYIEKAYLEDL